MWTPRRIVLFVTGLLMFSTGFTFYSRLFGWIDGLPPLPDKLTQRVIIGDELPALPGGVTPIQARLRQAFGVNCIEQTYNMKFEVRDKGILFAAADSKILDDGRVQLQQLSVAVFGKSNNREITTVHADRAFLTFDKPVRKIDDMGSRKVTAAELHADSEFPTSDPRRGQVHLTNNRRTPEVDDDMILRTAGPIFYVDEPATGQPHIWTASHVELTDRQNRPVASQVETVWQVPTVKADGLRVFLVSDVLPPLGGPKKADKKLVGSVSGVQRLELERNVVMNVWSESRNIISGPEKNPAAKKAESAPREKVLIQIQTNGPFTYDLIKEFAHFEVPPQREPGIQEYVKVTRKTKGNSEDTLTADALDIQFRRRKPAPGGTTPVVAPSNPEKAASPQDEMDIETIHAWGRNIALSSDDDALYAFGNDLHYDARLKQTVLRGSPMHAVKDGNLIRSPEFIMANLDDKEKQHVRARGPGMIGMGDMDPKTQEHSRQAHWNDWLVVMKAKENGKDLDVITLTGGASFLDTVNEQRLSSRQIKLWLLGREDKPTGKQPTAKTVVKVQPKKLGPDAKAEPRKQPLPHRLEAENDVVASSPELIVRKSEYLNIVFRDVPPKLAAEGKAVSEAPKAEPKGMVGSKTEPAPKKEQVLPKKKKDPALELRHARRIETWVNRVNGRNEVEKVHTEGNVVIHQDPTAESERGVDIAGHAVDMERYPDGNYLIVTGNDRTMGEVHFDKVSIIADDIQIDQRDNTANVKGPGDMRLLSQTTLNDGKPLDKPTWIDIHWNDAMELDGPIRSVRFEGRVTAEQVDGKVLCETMQVWLDRPLYLNQAERAKDPLPKKGDRSPKVEKVLCDQQPREGTGRKALKVLPVTIEDQEKKGTVLLRYQRVEGLQIDMDNAQNKLMAIGPGSVRIFQRGAKDPLADKPKDDKKMREKAKDDEEMKLTWVSFAKHMIAFNSLPKRAIFRDAVELVHMPATTHDVNINIAKLPERALYLRCNESLEVTTQSRKVRGQDGKEVEIKWQEMIAEGNVRVRSDNFDGWAGTVTYSEEKSQLVFKGTTENPAVLRRAEIPGGERKSYSGKRITYNIKTRDFNVEESLGGGSN